MSPNNKKRYRAVMNESYWHKLKTGRRFPKGKMLIPNKATEQIMGEYHRLFEAIERVEASTINRCYIDNVR